MMRMMNRMRMRMRSDRGADVLVEELTRAEALVEECGEAIVREDVWGGFAEDGLGG